MFNLIRSIWNPAGFHGLKKDQFEGWYYKIVNKDRDHVLAFIPGISNIKGKGDEPHAFIQFFDGTKETYNYHRFPITDFKCKRNIFDVKIKRNRFLYDKVEFDLQSDNQSIKGGLHFTDIKPWPVKWYSPGVMGPLAFIPKLQNYHGVLSFDHRVDGQLEIDGREVDFSGGRGYIEKDWGKAHADSWIWMQSNSFMKPGISISAAIATVPVPILRKTIKGFIIGLLLDNGKLYTFSSYDLRSRVKEIVQDNNTTHFTIKKGKLFLKVTGTQIGGVELFSPLQDTGMKGKIKESLNSTIDVKLFDQDELLFEGVGRFAGMEWRGVKENLRT